jgi:copper transport protein
VSLDFSEEVVPVSVVLFSADGQVKQLQDSARTTGSSLVISIPEPLRDGAYLLSYRAISADSHPVSGSLNFTVGHYSANVVVNPLVTHAIGGSTWRSQSLRALQTLVWLLALGGVLFRAVVQNPGDTGRVHLRRQILFSASAGLVLGVLYLTSTAADFRAGIPATQLSIVTTGSIVARSSLGVSLAVALLGLMLILVSEGVLSRRSLAVAVTGAVLVAASRVLTGHARAFEPHWLLGLLIALHFLMVGFWYGSIPPLLRIIKSDSAASASVAIDRFSRAAIGAVPVIVLSGLVLIVAYVGSVEAVVATTYGRLFLVKLTLVALVISLAAINKLRLTPALSRGVPGAALRLRQVIVGEFVALTAAVVLASLMASSAPRTSDAASRAHSTRTLAIPTAAHTVAAGSVTLQWRLANTGASGVELHLEVRGSNGALEDAAEADAELSLPEKGVEAMRVNLVRQARGQFSGRYSGMLLPGHWTVRFAVLLNEFDRVSAEDTLDIRP